jgi:hypothetical protein
MLAHPVRPVRRHRVSTLFARWRSDCLPGTRAVRRRQQSAQRRLLRVLAVWTMRSLSLMGCRGISGSSIRTGAGHTSWLRWRRTMRQSPGHPMAQACLCTAGAGAISSTPAAARSSPCPIWPGSGRSPGFRNSASEGSARTSDRAAEPNRSYFNGRTLASVNWPPVAPSRRESPHGP